MRKKICIVSMVVSLLILVTIPYSFGLSNTNTVKDNIIEINNSEAVSIFEKTVGKTETDGEKENVIKAFYIIRPSLKDTESGRRLSSTINKATTQQAKKVEFEDGTPYIIDLLQVAERLDNETKSKVQLMVSVTPSALDNTKSTDHFEIHYTNNTSSIDNTTDDFANKVADYFENKSYQTEVTEWGYREGNSGILSSKYQVYINHIDCTPNCTTYGVTKPTLLLDTTIEINNQISEYDDGLILGTSAHEYHHASQNSYDSLFILPCGTCIKPWAKFWVFEGSAAWMEHEVFRKYFPDNMTDNDIWLFVDRMNLFMNTPYKNIEDNRTYDDGHSAHGYPSGLYWYFLANNTKINFNGTGMNRTANRKFWEELGTHTWLDVNGAINDALSSAPSNYNSFDKSFKQFTRANYFKDSWYPADINYIDPVQRILVDLTSAQSVIETSGIGGVSPINHYAAEYFKIQAPGSSYVRIIFNANDSDANFDVRVYPEGIENKEVSIPLSGGKGTIITNATNTAVIVERLNDGGLLGTPSGDFNITFKFTPIDTFGYTYTDSNTLGGPTYDWIEINTTGTKNETLNNSDDHYVDNIPVGFFFNFYGTDYSHLSVTNNGLILASGGTSQFINQPIGSSTPHNFIAPFWDDIVTWGSGVASAASRQINKEKESKSNFIATSATSAPPGAIYYQTLGTAPNRMFVVEWYDNQHFTYSQSGVTFEAILYEGSNNIKFQYKDVDFGTVTGSTSSDLPPYDKGGSTTVGIEGPDGRGLQYSYNQQVLSPSLAILFKFPQYAGTNLYLSKQAPASKDRNSTMVYTLYYHNFGDIAATNVVLNDTLPAGVEFISASDSGSYTPITRKVTWNIGNLAPSSHGYENITVKINQSVAIGTVIQNNAIINNSNLEVRYDDNEAQARTRVTGSKLPPDVSVEPNNGGDTPSIVWHTPITFTYNSSCATGVGINIHINDGGSDITGTMVETSPDTWTYTTSFSRTGAATINYTVSGCTTPSVSFSIYIDPAGYIYDIDNGARISGATVWLQRPDGTGGWENVSTGQIPPIMQPDVNPLITGVNGSYQWDVLAGSYRVHVEAPGYYSANSIVVSVSPPVSDLNVGLTRIGSPLLLVSSVTPNSRIPQVGIPVTVFMSVINGGTGTATGVSITQASSLPVSVSYQQWNGTAFTNSPNTPVDILAGGTANFVLSINATAAFNTSSLTFNVSSTNGAISSISRVNTMIISGSSVPYADVIMISTNLNLSTAVNTTTAFAVATSNVGTADATGVSLTLDIPSTITGLSYQVNETYPTNGTIKGPASGLTIPIGTQPTFAVFLTPTQPIAYDPANNRITLQLLDGTGKVIGAQSIAVSTT